MAWQQYKRSRYYTQSRRVQGQVRREYIGGGLPGRLAATLDEQIGKERKRLLEAYQALRNRAQELQGLSRQFEQLAELVTGAALVVEGLSTVGRHLWRHRPHLASLDAEWVDIGLVEQVRDLLRQAQQRRPQAVADLRELLEGPEVWPTLEGLEERPRRLALELLAGGDLSRQQQFEEEPRKLARRLAGPTPSPVIGLFARRASSAWLEVHVWTKAADRLRNLTVYRPTFLLACHEQACRRYRAAVRGIQQLIALRGTEEEPQEL
jgi:hypothetical protein